MSGSTFVIIILVALLVRSLWCTRQRDRYIRDNCRRDYKFTKPSRRELEQFVRDNFGQK